MSDQTVLVVDDDLDIRSILAMVLELEGYRVVTAPEGEAALQRIREGCHPSVILLDLMMPGMNGWSFRERQLLDPSLAKIPVVVLTGDPDALRRAPLPGVAWVWKPVDLDTLLDVVAHSASPA